MHSAAHLAAELNAHAPDTACRSANSRSNATSRSPEADYVPSIHDYGIAFLYKSARFVHACALQPQKMTFAVRGTAI
jgi:hypothetical protein